MLSGQQQRAAMRQRCEGEDRPRARCRRRPRFNGGVDPVDAFQRVVADAAAATGSGGLSKGSSIGRYLVLSLVGRGGMGEVYAAYDPELDRKVAVKLLHAQGESSGAHGRGRLLREAKAIARLSHPNVVVVYDAGTFEERVFVAMEF